jgi:hypothetical protein
VSKPIFVAAGLLALAMPVANVSITSVSTTSEPLRDFFLETRWPF